MSVTFVARPSGLCPPLPSGYVYIDESDSDSDVEIVETTPRTKKRHHPYARPAPAGPAARGRKTTARWVRPNGKSKDFKLTLREKEMPNKGFKTVYAGNFMPLDAADPVQHLKKQKDFDRIAGQKLELAKIGNYSVCLVKYKEWGDYERTVISGNPFEIHSNINVLYVILDQNNKLVDMPVSVYRRCVDMMHDLYQTNRKACKAFGIVHKDEPEYKGY